MTRSPARSVVNARARPRALARSLLILAVAFLCAAATVLLPTDDYQRWQLLDGTIHRNARWFYERIHYDPAPIDVMVVGPSRIARGLDPVRLGDALAARGLPANVVNFAMPETGRNMNELIVREAFKTKRPKLIIIGIIEQPSRFGHSAYKYVAPSGDLIAPGYFGDVNYFSDLIYLPYRQLELFAANLLPGPMGLTKTFDPHRYGGHVLSADAMLVPPAGQTIEREHPGDPAEIERGVHKLVSGTHAPILPPRLADVEFGDERYFVREIVREAKAHGAKVAFVLLPYYSATPGAADTRFYQPLGPVWDASFVAPREELFSDYAHLDRAGADIVTDWLAPQVAELLERKP